ncbi:hypothetical protein P3X46_023542 [Hevea brasiliensis]|uniref:RecQ-mediated genome instability protein 1 n=1 Tax=Hevea brasiliensis TaxID=3981 RepID=A0ABQ9LBA7_HEVBR|nr:recQ-mediated genome instability protein 1 [Hevea brasiliensis]KAJ9163920.1 hypothetical protein P3X46_023542 [Hevea brasiliensis]
MPRRRLMLNSYSDEDEDQENQLQEQDHENGVHSQHEPAANHLPSNPNPNLQEPVPISDDDDFVDVSDNLTPPSPPLDPIPNHSPQQSPLVPPGTSGCPVGDFLLRMGLKLKREWLNSCLHGLESSVRHLDVEAKAKLCFQQFLFSDMNYCGGGVLPPNVDSMHLVHLAGPFVLQVDEIVNISCPLKGRYQDAPSGVKRCLKLSMTDGLQRVFGMEYRPIKDLQVLASAGLKVVICNVHIWHGLLMLVPEALEVLGGMVDELEAARQLLVNEVNKPPRGKRSRTGVVPPLATRATLAAWPCNAVNIPGNTNTSVDVHGNTNSSSTVLSHNNDFVNVLGHTNPSVSVHGHANSSDVIRSTNSSILQGVTPFQADQGATIVAPGTSRRTTEEFAASMSSGNNMPNSSSSVVSDVEEMHIDASFNRENAVSNVISNHEDVHMVDEFEHPLILSGDREIPFTYLASLSAKWAAMKEKTSFVQGKVKCFLTGVKRFQYKRRTTYELRVYVDDGSLISEILIDHDVVQKGIGHSPEEVTGALSSSDAKRVGDMKETLRQFQIFLVNFEGTMRVEMNRTSPLPVALEMSRGCSASDAWLLMRRLKSSASGQIPHRPSSDPIDISP